MVADVVEPEVVSLENNNNTDTHILFPYFHAYNYIIVYIYISYNYYLDDISHHYWTFLNQQLADNFQQTVNGQLLFPREILF